MILGVPALDSRAIVVVIYLIALAAPFVLARLGVLRPSRWGPFNDRQLRWAWVFVGVLVGPYLLLGSPSVEAGAREQLRAEGFEAVAIEQLAEGGGQFAFSGRRDGQVCSGVVSIERRAGRDIAAVVSSCDPAEP